ncbi:major histocompatibility complex class I-related gene protein-like [Ahaetulla prasina]|uniref:major histocompatibility complex class I-related gene protein-like n=1 Tax=Ahaetulla prasina TaxID=499056 RepID=UPI002649096D|nr:major histocompatibility complex class I-related gene protein-like [Ahaetulla prasina]
MALRSAALSLLLLVLVAVALQESCCGASSHSMKYFFSSISDPNPGQPQHVAVGFVDGQIFVHYDSNSRRMKPRVSWMEQVGKEDPNYWERNTQMARDTEEASRGDLKTLRVRYNQSNSLHTWQRMYGCELRADGSRAGFEQYGYDGRTFISFDKETLTWVAPDLQAQISKRKWEALPVFNQRGKAYLEEVCIKWLQKHLSYGKETLLRTEPPMVTLSSRTEVEDGMETHICRVHGFYPREIDASWRRDGEVWLEDTFYGSVAPNADGTYHYWLSVRIDPNERDRYRCHVEHDGLQEPLEVDLKEPKSSLGLIIGCFVAALVLVGVIAGILVFFKRRQDDYKAAPTSDKGFRSSEQGSHIAAPLQCKVRKQLANRPLPPLPPPKQPLKPLPPQKQPQKPLPLPLPPKQPLKPLPPPQPQPVKEASEDQDQHEWTVPA